MHAYKDYSNKRKKKKYQKYAIAVDEKPRSNLKRCFK